VAEKIAQMLVINSIKLKLLDQVAQIRHLDRSNPILLENDFQTGNEAVEISHMRKDVVGVKNVALLYFRR